MKTTYPIKTICEILDLTDRRVRQLVTDGILPKKSERGRYELIEHMTSRYSKWRNAKDARQPIPVRMSDDEPVGLMFFGDPHLDSPQCDWPELRRCVAICESTEGMRGVSLGATTRITG